MGASWGGSGRRAGGSSEESGKRQASGGSGPAPTCHASRSLARSPFSPLLTAPRSAPGVCVCGGVLAASRSARWVSCACHVRLLRPVHPTHSPPEMFLFVIPCIQTKKKLFPNAHHEYSRRRACSWAHFPRIFTLIDCFLSCWCVLLHCLRARASPHPAEGTWRRPKRRLGTLPVCM